MKLLIVTAILSLLLSPMFSIDANAAIESKSMTIQHSDFFKKTALKEMYRNARSLYLSSFPLADDELVKFERAQAKISGSRTVGYVIEIGTGGEESTLAVAYDASGKQLDAQLKPQAKGETP